MLKRTRAGVMLLLAMVSGAALAGEVVIERADFLRGQGDSWRVSVTLRHADTGWQHYADGWQVVDGEGKVLGHRTLFHPHVDEQPFTRSDQLTIPADLHTVYVEAHDTVHGRSPQRLKVALDQAAGRGHAERATPDR